MIEKGDRETEIIEAHQVLVGHIERSTTRIRALSAVTIVVSVALSVSYIVQLLLPLFGTSSVTVNLTDPGNQAAEVVVLALVLVWLYVGARNLTFASRIRKQIQGARSSEEEIESRISGAGANSGG